MRRLAVVLSIAASAVAMPAVAEARPCVSKGMVIKHREGVSCKKAGRVLTRHRQSGSTRGWECWMHPYRGRGYCESRRGYFDFKWA